MNKLHISEAKSKVFNKCKFFFLVVISKVDLSTFNLYVGLESLALELCSF